MTMLPKNVRSAPKIVISAIQKLNASNARAITIKQ